MRRPTLPLRAMLLAVLPLAACQGAQSSGSGSEAASGAGSMPGDMSETQAYSGIRADETVRFTGTEPFWGGQVAGPTLTYSTPETPDGTPIAVTRFAGRGGVSWTGTLQDRPFHLAITEGQCSDGMSDRTYPFTATLQVLGEQRQGCAWTERRPATLPEGAMAP